jgi:glycosyltransferase involved in cell wall biosynthesis
MNFLNLFKRRKCAGKTRLLFVGHDFKFLTHVMDYFSNHPDYETGEFSYKGHLVTEPGELKNMLPDYDLLFCEWGLGNVSWLSWNKLSRHKLITRIHLQEFSTKFIHETNWNAVDAMIFINRFQLERFVSLFPDQKEKCHLIYNLISCSDFNKPKLNGSIFTLGQLGVLPMRKSPHLAVEILRNLKSVDDRFKLTIKSKRPEELDWLWRRDEEREYYSSLYETIKLQGLEESVIFEPHGPDVPEWYQKVGFLLSTSDFEGSHQSVAEGMAAGSIPIVRNWDGADMLYPDRFVFKTTDEAVELIKKYTEHKLFLEESETVREFAVRYFDIPVILEEYESLLNSLK